ncbi:Plant UBX domain-containing protein 10 [Raphanus sativus]|nr:Plant UBX domain-containing protein 10 [Raphanus sativus]
MPAANQRIALLQQVKGLRTPKEMIAIMQRVVEDSSPVIVNARVEAEERRTNLRLREEQDAAYRAALEADQVLVLFPNGERKGRRFESNTKIQTLYDYIDSLGVLDIQEYNLRTNFPRTVYGRDKDSMSLKDAGLHPQASLFIEIN